METLSLVRGKDEQQYGDYRTKQAILELYDEMQPVMGQRSWIIHV
jgi:hypothetical protein